jgi:hypothetical protein
MFVTITVQGKNEGDLEDATREVASLIGEGFTSGTSEEMGQVALAEGASFHFDLGGDDASLPLVQVAFTANDAMALRPGMTQEQAEEFFAEVGGTLEDLLVERGNEAIAQLLSDAHK